MGHSSSDTVIVRLIIILSKLNSGEAISEDEMAKEFGVSNRTIQRDLNRLKDTFYIYKDKRDKKWRMKDEFKIEKVNNSDDKFILNILEKITAGAGGKFATKSKKLLDKLKNSEPNSIYVKINMEDISDKASVVDILENAIRDKKEVVFLYHQDSVTLQPLKIGLYEGFWYLIGFINGNIISRYYINDLENVRITNNSFEIDIDIEEKLQNSISVWFDPTVKPYEVRFLANHLISKYFKRKPLPTQKNEIDNPDGSMEFTIEITHDMEALQIIKYWIPHLRVISPKRIEDELRGNLIDYLDWIKK